MKKVYQFIFLLLAATVVQAQTTWTGSAGDTTWNTPGNWSTNQVPTSSDSVNFTNTSPQIVYFNADASAKLINFRGSANVMFALKGAAASTVRTINLGGTSPEHYNNTVLRFVGTTNSLTLNTNRSSGANSGIILMVLTGNKATITKTIHLSGNAATLPGQDSISSSQVNKIVAIDAGSVIFGNGGAVTVNQRNNGTGYATIFAGSATNGVVFQSGSSLSNVTSAFLDPFNTASGTGNAQFLSGSKFIVSNGATAIAISGSASAAFSNYWQGRTYGGFIVGNMSIASGAPSVYTNNTATTTSFLDSFVVDNGQTFNLTLVGSATTPASPTFSFNYIKIRSTAATPATNIAIRANTTAASIAATSVNISGNVDLIATASNTTAGVLQFVVGPNSTGGSLANTNINFTGNTTIKLTKGSAVTNPNFLIGSPTGGTTMPTNLTINNGATLNLGDSLTLRTGGSYTTLTIKPTGRLSLIDDARLTTNHNNNFNIESSAAGTGSIGEGNGIIINSGTVQHFIKGNAAWRLVGIPFSLSTKIKGGNNLSNSQYLYLNNIFASNHVYHFNDTLDNGKYGVGAGVNAGWVSMASDADSIQPNRGLLIYGSRAIGDQTVSYNGFFNNGDVSIPLSKITDGKGWNLLANPYVSNIDFETITQNPANAGVLAANTVYGVNPLGGGGYSFSSYVAGTGTGVNGGSRIIENGAAFFVKAADIDKTLVIRQSDKTTATVSTTTGGVSLLGASNDYSTIKISLDGANKQSDEVVFVWGRFKSATEGFDEDLDAYDLGASGTHDLAIVDAKGTRYSIFNGADLQKNTETRTYKLATKNLLIGTYSFAVTMPKAFNKNSEAFIVDNYLGTAVLAKEGLVHSFQVTTDAASKAEGRFQLEVRNK